MLSTKNGATSAINIPAFDATASAEVSQVSSTGCPESLSWGDFMLRVDRRCEVLEALRQAVTCAADTDQPLTRAELHMCLFQAFDADLDGRLSMAETYQFVTLVGFDGSLADWASDFRLLCNERKADPHKGLDVGMFVSMTNDDSDSGCYCKTSELLGIAEQVARIASAEQVPVPVPRVTNPEDS